MSPTNYSLLRKAGAPSVDLTQRGGTGLRQWGGYVDEEWHRELRGDRLVQMLREMVENSPVIGGIQLRLETIISQTPQRVVPADGSDAAGEWALFVEQCRNDMSHTWSSLTTEECSTFWAGYSFFEQCYKFRRGDKEDPDETSQYNDGKIGWGKIEIRAQESRQRWEFDADGDLLGMWQYATGQSDLRFVPIGKALHFLVRPRKGNPEGSSLFRPCYTSYRDAKHIAKIRSVGIERNLNGYPVLEAPAEYLSTAATSEQQTLRDDMLRQLGEMRRDYLEGAIMPASMDREGPTGWKFSLMSGGGSGNQTDATAAIVHCEQSMARAVIWESMMMGGDSGSLAMHSDKTAIMMLCLNSFLNSVCETTTRYAIRPLMVYNGVPQALWPTLAHDPVQRTDLTELSDFLSKVAAVGLVTPTAEIEGRLLELSSMPQRVIETTTAADGEPQTSAEMAQVENKGLQLEYLSRALQRLRDSGDTARADIVGAKIDELVRSM